MRSRPETSEIEERCPTPALKREASGLCALPERTEGDEVRVDEVLTDDESPIWFEYPSQFSKDRGLIGRFSEDVNQVRTVEARRRVRKAPAVAYCRRDVHDTRLGGPPHEVVEHRSLYVHDVDPSG
jgi:hypothetical protein